MTNILSIDQMKCLTDKFENSLDILNDNKERLILNYNNKEKNLKNILNDIEKFINTWNKKENYNLYMYGGTAVNSLMPNKDKFYNYNTKMKDLDYLFNIPNTLNEKGNSKHNFIDELVKYLINNSYENFKIKPGFHWGTFKLYVNYIAVADFTYINYILIEYFKCNQLKKNDINKSIDCIAPVDWLRWSFYNELSKPSGDISRWRKILKRLFLLNKNYPIKIEKVKKSKEIPKIKIYKKFFNKLIDLLINEKLIFIDENAYNYYINLYIKNKVISTPFEFFFSEKYEDSEEIILIKPIICLWYPIINNNDNIEKQKIIYNEKWESLKKKIENIFNGINTDNIYSHTNLSKYEIDEIKDISPLIFGYKYNITPYSVSESTNIISIFKIKYPDCLAYKKLNLTRNIYIGSLETLIANYLMFKIINDLKEKNIDSLKKYKAFSSYTVYRDFDNFIILKYIILPSISYNFNNSIYELMILQYKYYNINQFKISLECIGWKTSKSELLSYRDYMFDNDIGLDILNIKKTGKNTKNHSFNINDLINLKKNKSVIGRVIDINPETDVYKGKNIGDSIVIQFTNGTNLIEIIEIEHFKSDKLMQNRFLNNLIKIGSIKGLNNIYEGFSHNEKVHWNIKRQYEFFESIFEMNSDLFKKYPIYSVGLSNEEYITLWIKNWLPYENIGYVVGIQMNELVLVYFPKAVNFIKFLNPEYNWNEINDEKKELNIIKNIPIPRKTLGIYIDELERDIK